jgi:hypothetical protein
MGFQLKRMCGWWLAVLCVAGSLGAAEDRLADIRARFRGTDTPIVIEYDLGYRFLKIELSKLGKIHLTTTIGQWKHRVSGEEVPAVWVDVRVDSDDQGKPRERLRVCLHDEIVAVLTLPQLEALLFAKVTDESLRPLFGRRHVAQAVSCYDAQAGQMEYRQQDFIKDTVSTNLSHPEALLELTRQVGPIMEFLVSQYRVKTPGVSTNAPGVCISANLDGQVVSLRLDTRKERSPGCFGRRRLESLHIRTLPMTGGQARARDFHAWAVTFDALADYLGDDVLKREARESLAAVTPLVVDYELGLGRIRASIVSVKADTGPEDEPPASGGGGGAP